MGIIGGKWKAAILYALVKEGPLRFVGLRDRIPQVSQRILTQQLRDLERYGIIERTLHTKPSRVEYAVTPLGRSLDPIFKSVCDWGGLNFATMEQARSRFEQRSRGTTGS